MRPRSSCCPSAALAAFILLPAARRPSSTRSRGGPGLSPEDNRLLFDSIARLNAAVRQSRTIRGVEQPADEHLRHLHHTPGVPLA
jgi:hypothetical protein